MANGRATADSRGTAGSHGTAAARARPPRVVVIGAGFGGLRTCRGLRAAPVEILLVDRRNYHTFQPLLYQVATAGLEPEEIAHAVRGIFTRQRNLRFALGEVRQVDWDARNVVLDDGGREPFDFLVLAPGADTADYGVPGVREHAFGLKTLLDAVALRSHVLRRFEAASRDPSAVRPGDLDAVVVGGGPTGVEMAGALVELYGRVLRKDHPGLDVGGARVVLVEREQELLASFGPRLRSYAAEQLRRRGVEVRLGVGVRGVDGHGIELGDGGRLPARTVVWAAGVRAVALAGRLGVEQLRDGRLRVGPDLSLPGHPEAFALGDIAAVPDGSGGWLPQVAPVALQGGAHVAEALRSRIEGRPVPPFRYRDRGSMATIGRNAAVVQLPSGLRARGRLGWMLWLALHLVELIGFRNRLNVLVNWAWNYLTYDRSARLIIDLLPEPGRGAGDERGDA